MILYISLIDTPHYQNNITEISFEFSVWINKGSYVRRSPNFFKKSLGLILKTMNKYNICPVNSDTIVDSHNQMTFSDVKTIRIIIICI